MWTYETMTSGDIWAHAGLVFSLCCALAGAFFCMRWAARNVPEESKPRRLVQAFTIAGAIVGLVPGLVVGVLGGGDIGGAFVAIPFYFWLQLPQPVAGAIGMTLFMTGAVALLTLLGAAAGYSIGHFLGNAFLFVKKSV